jgi:hypothetical protein
MGGPYPELDCAASRDGDPTSFMLASIALQGPRPLSRRRVTPTRSPTAKAGLTRGNVPGFGRNGEGRQALVACG